MTDISQPPLPAVSPKTEQKGLAHRQLRWMVAAIAIVIALFALAVLNNNYSLRKPPRTQFSSQIDRAINNSTAWIVQHPDIQGNPPLMFMIGDMAEMSGDPRLRSFVVSYLAGNRVKIPDKKATWY